MSTRDDTDRLTETVKVPDNGGCHLHVDDDLLDMEAITATYQAAESYTYGDGKYTMTVPASVKVQIGNHRLVLTPEVWRAIHDAVEAVTPAEVVPA